MAFLRNLLALSTGLASLGGVYAELDLSSDNNVVVYWGQNSFKGEGELAQQRLGYYCDDDNIDVIVLAFLMTINGQGGAPEIDFSNANDHCKTFEGTNLKNCPEIGEDITKCQQKGKSIILSIGGATYSEGGFKSDADAKAGAELIWQTFGPPSSSSNSTTQGSGSNSTGNSSGNSTSASNSTNRAGNTSSGTPSTANRTTFHQPRAFRPLNGTRPSQHGSNKNTATRGSVHRPFGDAIVDGFDFDFEAAVTHMAPFANRLRELSDADSSKKYYLTAAPQCPYPDAADKDILQGAVSIDAVFVQFYNNFCGVNSFQKGAEEQKSFNFQTWDDWAKKVSKNKEAKVLLGVPANTGAASTGYISADELAPVIEYSKTFESFGGVMMWDVTQAYGNQGFLDGVRKSLSQEHSPLGQVYGVHGTMWRG